MTLRIPHGLGLWAVFLSWNTAYAGEASTTISKGVKDAQGVLVHTVACAFQEGKTQIRVLLPDRMEEGRRYPVIYLLPVEAGLETRFGDGLAEVQKLNLHNKLSVIFVMPTYSHLPWYADHPKNSRIRQESYFLQVVIPFMESHYPVQAARTGRFLLGFSKSGWGAWSLLLRHLDMFERAAAWDAPLAMTRPDRFGMGPILGDQENFEKYQIDKLLETKAKFLQARPRLAMTGYANFRPQHEHIHALLMRLEIPHHYRDVKQDKHTWGAGWLEEAARFLIR